MKVEHLELENTKSFSSFFLDYIKGSKTLDSFYGQKPEILNFRKQIESKEFDEANRRVLYDALVKQYENLDTKETTSTNVRLLQQTNTFTVTTGHQLNIFTGPLYFIYKIVSVINTCKRLKDQYQGYNFVPVYWMASEDHDFEEINHFNLFGQQYTWSCKEKGAVGRFSTSTLKDVLDSMPESSEVFQKAYGDHGNLADAVRCYINELFGDHGVVVVDADDSNLKSQFSIIIKDDLLNHHANDLVEESSSKLTDLGYRPQIFPRAINFFYLKDQLRERIVKEDSGWKILNTDILFSETELTEELEKHPERFSPNVVMRPLYQEVILPNLAYIGGPSEVVYWLQLKSTFDHYKVSFPVLMPRNFGLIINKASQKKMDKFNLSNDAIFDDAKELQAAYIERHSDSIISLNDETEQIAALFGLISEKSKDVDASLQGFIGAEANKTAKSLENIQKRLKKAEEQKHEVALGQISGLKDKLFPKGSLQERHDNFLNFYLNNDQFINQLVQVFDPFDFRFYILKED